MTSAPPVTPPTRASSATDPWQQANRRLLIASGVLLGLLAIAVLVASTIGALRTPWNALPLLFGEWLGLGTAELDQASRAVLVHLRIPRILFGVIVGAGLGISGAAIQGLFRNPLAAPEVIGSSSGAATGAVLAILATSMMGLVLPAEVALMFRPVSAFVGAVLVTGAIYRFATDENGTNVLTMLLAGIAAGALTGSVIGLASFFSDDAALRDITLWMLGSLAAASWKALGILVVTVGLGSLWLLRQSTALDLLLLGEAEASHLGTDVRKLKSRIILGASLVLAASVSFTGMIGFIGLVVPHMVRLAIGPAHRALLPVSALGGAVLLTVADTIARTIAAPSELPLGVITALLGAPVFLYLLNKEARVVRGGA